MMSICSERQPYISSSTGHSVNGMRRCRQRGSEPMADVATQQAINSLSHYPGGPSSGTGSDSQDATAVGGQDPTSLFGIPISYDSGAEGTPAPGGQSMAAADP